MPKANVLTTVLHCPELDHCCLICSIIHIVVIVFMHCVCSGNGSFLTAQQFMWFLNEEQRDPRLNEILHPYCDVAKAQSLIAKFEPDDKLSEAGIWTFLSIYLVKRKQLKVKIELFAQLDPMNYFTVDLIKSYYVK